MSDLLAAFFRVVDGHFRALGQAFAGFVAESRDAAAGLNNRVFPGVEAPFGAVCGFHHYGSGRMVDANYEHIGATSMLIA